MFPYEQLYYQLNPEAHFFAVLNTRVAFKAVIKVRSSGILNASQL